MIFKQLKAWPKFSFVMKCEKLSRVISQFSNHLLEEEKTRPYTNVRTFVCLFYLFCLYLQFPLDSTNCQIVRPISFFHTNAYSFFPVTFSVNGAEERMVAYSVGMRRCVCLRVCSWFIDSTIHKIDNLADIRL